MPEKIVQLNEEGIKGHLKEKHEALPSGPSPARHPPCTYGHTNLAARAKGGTGPEVNKTPCFVEPSELRLMITRPLPPLFDAFLPCTEGYGIKAPVMAEGAAAGVRPAQENFSPPGS